MTTGRKVAFCPQCEEKYSGELDLCPEDGARLVEYEFVESEPTSGIAGAVLDDRFRVEEPLGSGGMGTVFRGTQTGVERDVAIKVLEGEAARDERKVQRFLREARTLSNLSNPNIVSFIDFGRDEEHGALYLVMELLDGVSLDALSAGKRLHPNIAIEVTAQVCAALAEPHRKDVVHRDLKPANMMLQTRLDGRLQTKLVDFGIADAMRGQTRLTRTGVACGTPHYMAPEHIEERDITPAVDIYGIGAVLYRLLTGQFVFDASADMQILLKHVQQPAPSMDESGAGDEIPSSLSALVDRLLAKEPRERPQSVLDVREQLLDIRDAQPNWHEIRVDPDRPLRTSLTRWVEPTERRRSGPEQVTTADQFGVPETGEVVRDSGGGQRLAEDGRVASGERAGTADAGLETQPAQFLKGETVRDDALVEERLAPEESEDGPRAEASARSADAGESSGDGADTSEAVADVAADWDRSTVRWRVGAAVGGVLAVGLVATFVWQGPEVDGDAHAGEVTGASPVDAGSPTASRSRAAARDTGASGAGGVDDVVSEDEDGDEADVDVGEERRADRERQRPTDHKRRAGDRSETTDPGASRHRGGGDEETSDDVEFEPMPVGGGEPNEASGGRK